MDSESEEVSENSVDIPETGDSDGDDAMEPVREPEQQTFLSRLAEIGGSSSVLEPNTPARFNFGMKDGVGALGAKEKNDKGYAGVLHHTQKPKNKKRIKKENIPKLSDKQDNIKAESTSRLNPIPDEHTQSVPYKPVLEAKQLSTTSNVPDLSSKISPLGLSGNSGNLSIPKSMGSISKMSSKLSSDKLNNPFGSIPDLIVGNNKPSLPQTLNHSAQLSNFTLPTQLEPSDKPSTFTLPTQLDLGCKSSTLGAIGSTNFTIPTQLKPNEKPSTFILPTQLGQVPSTSAAVNPSTFSLPKLGSSDKPSSFQLPSLGANKPVSSATSGSGISLNSLATLQFGQPTTGSESGSKLSLSSLANLHLSTAPPSSGFALPSLTGQNPPSLTGPTQPSLTVQPILSRLALPDKKQAVREPSPELEIDLTSALKLNVDEERIEDAQVSPKKVETIILVDLTNLKSSMVASSPSAAGKVLCKSWRRRIRMDPLKFKLIETEGAEIPRFAFQEPSPDDIVKKAQTQSRAFNNRQSPAR